MSDSEANSQTTSPPTEIGPAAAASTVPTTAPTRVLPSQSDVARWMRGEDVPCLAALFDTLILKRFDTLYMQVRKDELLPQHWQVISDHNVPLDAEFDQLAEIGRLRVAYRDQQVARPRIEHLKLAWRELGGKRPSLWTVPDLFAAMRRLIEQQIEIDFHELLSAARDIWLAHSLPHGREQLDILWPVLDLIRAKTKK